jgi:hypothetical protein
VRRGRFSPDMSHCVGSVRNVYKAFIDITIDQRFTELEKYLIDKDCEIENEQLSEASRLSSIIASSRFLYKNPDIAPQGKFVIIIIHVTQLPHLPSLA